MSSLLSFLEEHGVPYRVGGTHHHVSHGWAGADCPYCSEVGKFHLGIHLSSLKCSCWKCGGHPIGQVLQLLTQQSWFVVKRFLDQTDRNYSLPDDKNLKRTKVVIPPEVGDLKPCHYDYLSQRGFDPIELVAKWGLKGIGISSRLSWRIWIPVHYRQELVSWTTRTIGGNKPRYLNAKPEEERISPKQLLFGEDHVRFAVVVCEGPLDVFKVGYGAVSLMGMKASSEQLRKLSLIPVRVVCLDAEEEAQRRARKLCQSLSMFPGTTHNIILESGKDPGEATETELNQLRSFLT